MSEAQTLKVWLLNVCSHQEYSQHFRLRIWTCRGIHKPVPPNVLNSHYPFFYAGIFAVLKKKCQHIHESLQG